MRGTMLFAAAAIAAVILFSLRMAHADEEAGGSEAPVQAADHLGTQRYALVIGIDDYADRDVPDLRSRENGARGVQSVLLDQLIGGVPKAHVQLLLGAEATAAKVRAALGELQRLPKKATVFVYFSGHGAQEGEDAYWVMQDSREDDLPATAVEDAEVRRLLGQIPAERILLMMDCRHEAGLVGDGKARVDHAGVLRRYHGTGYATLGVAESEEHLIDSQGSGRSVFTHYLIQGLSGQADADEDGIVVLDELATTIGRRVRSEARKRSGLERPVVDLEGVRDPSRFLLTIEQEAFGQRLLDDEEAQIRRRERLAALTALHEEDGITIAQVRDGRHLLGTLPEGFEPHELEQRTMLVDLTEGRLAPEHLADALASIRRADRRTLVVPDQYKTIQSAIDAAVAGDTVFVKTGGYDEHVVFKNGICLRGEGRERTLIRMVSGKPEILLVQDCAWGSILSLQVCGTGGEALGDWRPDGFHVNRSRVRITDCIAHRCLGCGMYAVGTGCWPYVQDSTFEQNRQDGACFDQTDGGLIVDSICRSNGAVGIQVRTSPNVIVIRACLCELNTNAGIGASSGSRAIVEGNECQRNGGHGILLWDAGTSVSLEGNSCTKNEVSGIYVVQRAAAVANGNVCSRNKACGIVASGAGTRATVVGNRCLDNDLSDQGDLGGIVFREGARGDVTSNTCDGNTCGILITGSGTKVRLQDNTCRRNKTSGIDFSKASPGNATGNQCEENEHGITVSNTEVTLQGNTLSCNTMYGIFISRGGTCNASGNRCEGNAQAGIHVTGAGTRAELLKNTCTSNGSHGIQFALGASGTADGNDCSENKAFGILALNGGTRPTFRRNRCTNNGRAGIGKEGGAAPIVESNNTQSGNGQ